MNETLLKNLGRFKDTYPYQLDAKFSHIIDNIVKLWSSPPLIALYLTELLIDARGYRQGFPPEIAREIFVLSNTYDQIHAEHEQKSNLSAQDCDNAKQQLEQLNFQLAPAPVLKASEFEDLTRIEAFRKPGVQVDSRDNRDWTPLMISAFKGNEVVAKVLIDYGANPQERDARGCTPLHWAALNGHAGVIRMLLDRGVDVNARSNSDVTALLQAATKGRTTAVVLLLEAGANPEIASHNGCTPLHQAVLYGHAQTVRILVEAGASIFAQDKDGSTSLALAQKRQSQEILKILYQAIR